MPEARLQISVEQPGTEGEKFFALCEWTAVRFPKAVLVVSDTLQRHNLMFESGISEDAAAAAWRTRGDAWLTGNAPAIELMSNREVVRWDQALAHEETAGAAARLNELYRQGGAFQDAVDATVDRFWRRNAARDKTYSPERHDCFKDHSRAFLREELAVFCWLCRREGIDVHAGSWLELTFRSLRKEADNFFDAFRKDWLQIDYTRNGGFSC